MAFEEPRLVNPEPDSDAAAEAALDRLEHAAREFLALETQSAGSPRALLHATAASMHRFITSIDACEAAGLDADGLRPRIDALRALHGRSPFVNRLQTWPRGYQGDFETVERLCDATNEAPLNTVAPAIEQCAIQSPIAQQHRNKVAIQARAILATALRVPEPRIASLGCGGCRDLGLVLDCLPADRGCFVLTDADAGALDLARARLSRLGDRCHFVHGRVPRSLAVVARLGPFDLVVAASSTTCRTPGPSPRSGRPCGCSPRAAACCCRTSPPATRSAPGSSTSRNGVSSSGARRISCACSARPDFRPIRCGSSAIRRSSR